MNHSFLTFTDKKGLHGINLNHVVKIDYIWNDDPKGLDSVEIHLINNEVIKLDHEDDDSQAGKILNFIQSTCLVSERVWQ